MPPWLRCLPRSPRIVLRRDLWSGVSGYRELSFCSEANGGVMSPVAALAADAGHGRQHRLVRVAGDSGWVHIASPYGVCCYSHGNYRPDVLKYKVVVRSHKVTPKVRLFRNFRTRLESGTNGRSPGDDLHPI